MRVMARQAIADRWWMNLSFNLRGILIGVAGEAQLIGSSGDELYVCDVFIRAYFMAAHTSHGHRRMHGFTFSFVLMAGEASRGIGFWIERNRMLCS